MFEQDEHQDHQHDARGFYRHPNRAENLLDELHGTRRRLVQLHRDRNDRGGPIGGLRCRRRLLGLHRRRTLIIRMPIDQPPCLHRECIQSADRNVVQRLDLVLDGPFVARQALRHVHQLRTDNAGDGRK